MEISIRAPTRGATRYQRVNGITYTFQSALPRGERLANAYETINRNRISIRAPTRGATPIGYGVALSTIDFNPRSHEGSDFEPDQTQPSTGISIRAPTRGATRFLCFFSMLFIISIRAPTRGATEVSRPHK